MKKRNLPKIIISVLLVAAIGWGSVYYLKKNNSGTQAKVYPVEQLAMPAEMGMGSQESLYGQVTASDLQDVRVTESQKIHEILVKEGQSVKKGDPILHYDSTLTQLTLEKLKNQIQKQEMALQKAQSDYDKTLNYYPGVAISEGDMVTPGSGAPISGGIIHGSIGESIQGMMGNGLKPAFINGWINLGALPSDTTATTTTETSTTTTASETTTTTTPTTQPTPTPTITPEPTPEPTTAPTTEATTQPTTAETTEPTTTTTPAETTTTSSTTAGTTETKKPTLRPEDFLKNEPAFQGGKGTEKEPYTFLYEEGDQLTEAFVRKALQQNEKVFVNLQVLDQYNLPLLFERVKEVNGQPVPPPAPGDTKFPVTVKFFFPKANDLPDDNFPPFPDFDPPIFEDPGIVLTAAEIAKIQADALATLKSQEISLRELKLELDAKQKEMNNTTIYAEMDGVVNGLIDVETAVVEGQPLLKITKGGGYVVRVYVDEYTLPTLKIGDLASVTDFMQGNMAEGSILQISQSPENQQDYYSQAVASKYAVYIQVPAEANLQTYSDVQVMLMGQNTDALTGSFYLQKIFVFSEEGKHYVWKYVDGKTVKQEVKIGKMLWGDYLEILEGLAMEDHIGFPPSRFVGENNPAKIATIEELQGGF